MCIKIFHQTSAHILPIDAFHKQEYIILDKWKQTKTKWLWCTGIREQKSLEKKLILVGNIPIEKEITINCVSADFQFKVIEKTCIQLFHFD